MKKIQNIAMFMLAVLVISTQSCKDDKGEATPEEKVLVKVETIEYKTFEQEHIAFGGGKKQTVEKTFTMHPSSLDIDNIKMFVILDCPSGGCNIWDVYANIKVKDKKADKWYEIGRYITPYGIDNSPVEKGFEIDVTDFKSLLSGEVELRARIETWGADGWNLTVNFEVTTGEPDYQYYAVSDVIMFDAWSTSGVPYGVDHNKDLTKTVAIPTNSKETSLRTIISGWGHATPTDADGRPCAEWCYRTHDIKIDGATAFNHQMSPLGCATNPVKNQRGNWQPDRAGWCPGMAVPVRVNTFDDAKAGKSFDFEYDYEDWTSDGGTTSGNKGAYYATSCFVVVKSDTPIDAPTVTD
ncbi:MAG: peptidase [Bacteroidetes bacterium]|nr:peptidase [Bacteroidota bacterium]